MKEQNRISKEEALFNYYEDKTKINRYCYRERLIKVLAAVAIIVLDIVYLALLISEEISCSCFDALLVTTAIVVICSYFLILCIMGKQVVKGLSTKDIGCMFPNDIESFVYGDWLIMENPQYYTKMPQNYVECTESMNKKSIKYLVGNQDFSFCMTSHAIWNAMKSARNVKFLIFDLKEVNG